MPLAARTLPLGSAVSEKPSRATLMLAPGLQAPGPVLAATAASEGAAGGKSVSARTTATQSRQMRARWDVRALVRTGEPDTALPLFLASPPRLAGGVLLRGA